MTQAEERLHNLSISMASYIAEIDRDSSRVASYIEQRLRPLVDKYGSDPQMLDVLAEMCRYAKRG